VNQAVDHWEDQQGWEKERTQQCSNQICLIQVQPIRLPHTNAYTTCNSEDLYAKRTMLTPAPTAGTHDLHVHVRPLVDLLGHAIRVVRIERWLLVKNLD